MTVVTRVQALIESKVLQLAPFLYCLMERKLMEVIRLDGVTDMTVVHVALISNIERF
jgi:hypothetical protein